MDTPIEFSINDPRLKKDFKGITISGYKRTDVVNVFIILYLIRIRKCL